MVRNKFIKTSVKTATLGEKLKEIRSERRISIGEVSKATKIQPKYLESLEEGKYNDLPAEVYVKGFLKAYALFLGVNDSALIKAFERERAIQKNISKKNGKETFTKPINISNFTVTPKHLVFALVTIFVFLGFFYIYREANLFISTPRLVVLEPADGLVTQERTVKIAGMAEKDSEVSINNQSVMVDDEGKFSENIELQKGINTVTVRAKNRFDKESVKTIQIKGEFPEETAESSGGQNLTSEENAKQESLKMEISVSPGPSWVAIEVDGSLVFSGIMQSGENKSFEAQDRIVVSSAKGNNTYVKINEKDKQVLSSDSGMVKNITFTAGN